jgi:predicted flap endonuclease-1-like 5' DNA nuclease
MKKQTDSNNTKANVSQSHSSSSSGEEEDEIVGYSIDENTTLDVIVSPLGYVTELSDTVDSMDGATTEVIDIVNQADGTDIELTRIEEPTDQPGVDSVDRFLEIKGIGPRVAELLMQAGIRQFSELAETPIERIREILSSAGSHYRIYDPSTWPQQAKLLADGKLDELNLMLATQRTGEA